MNNYLKGVIMVLISACAFALQPTFALFAYQNGITVFTMLFFRFFLAGILFVFCLYLWPEKIILTKKVIIRLFFLGTVIYTMQSAFYFTAVKYIPPSLAVLIVYTHPVIITGVSSFLYHQPLTKKVVLSVLVSFLGMVLVLGTSFQGVNIFGVLLAFGAAVIYSAYVLMSNNLLKTVPPITAGIYISFSASIGLLITGFLTKSFSLNFQAGAWPWVIGLVIVSTVLGMLTFFRGLKVLGPSKATILSMVEPIFGIIFSILLFQDHFNFLQMIGAAGIISGAVAAVYKRESKV